MTKGQEGATLTLCDTCIGKRGMVIGHEWAGFRAVSIFGVLDGKCGDCDFEATL